MNASWVVVVANLWGWVNLHTAVAHRVVVGIAVGVVASNVAVTHTGEALAAVRMVIVVAGSMVAVAPHRMTTLAGSGHCPSVLPPGLRAVFLPIVGPLYQVQLIFFLLKRWEAEFFGYEMPSLTWSFFQVETRQMDSVCGHLMKYNTKGTG